MLATYRGEAVRSRVRQLIAAVLAVGAAAAVIAPYTKSALGETTDRDRLVAFTMSPADPRVLYLIASYSDETHPAVYRSDDGGASWELVYEFQAYSSRPDELVADAADPNTVWNASPWAGVVVSRDGGRTWHTRGGF